MNNKNLYLQKFSNDSFYLNLENELIKTAGLKDSVIDYITGIDAKTRESLREINKFVQDNGGLKNLQQMASDYKEVQPIFRKGMEWYNKGKPFLPYIAAGGLGALGGGLFGGGSGALMGGLGTMALMYLFRDKLFPQNKAAQNSSQNSSQNAAQNKAQQQANVVPQGKEFTGNKAWTRDSKGNLRFTEDYLKHRYANPGSDKLMNIFNVGANNFDGTKSYSDAISDNYYNNANRLNEIQNKNGILQTLRTANPNSKEYNDANTFFKQRTGKEWGSLDDKAKQKYLRKGVIAQFRANKAMDESQKQVNNNTLNPAK